VLQNNAAMMMMPLKENAQNFPNISSRYFVPRVKFVKTVENIIRQIETNGLRETLKTT